MDHAQSARTRRGQLRKRMQKGARIHAAAESHGKRPRRQCIKLDTQQVGQRRGHLRMVPEPVAHGMNLG
jgi:hypothetical protein